MSNTSAALRLLDGLTDTDDNFNDFAVLAPNPRNSASPPNTPVTTGPGPGTTPLAEPSSLMLMLSALIAAPWLRRRHAARGRLS